MAPIIKSAFLSIFLGGVVDPFQRWQAPACIFLRRTNATVVARLPEISIPGSHLSSHPALGVQQQDTAASELLTWGAQSLPEA